MPAAAVATRTPATGGISGKDAGARGEMEDIKQTSSCAGLACAPMRRSSVPLGSMDCRVKSGNDDQSGNTLVLFLYFFDGAAGLSEVSGPAGLSRRSTLLALRSFSTISDWARWAM